MKRKAKSSLDDAASDDERREFAQEAKGKLDLQMPDGSTRPHIDQEFAACLQTRMIFGKSIYFRMMAGHFSDYYLREAVDLCGRLLCALAEPSDVGTSGEDDD